MADIKSVCVFCGSSMGSDPIYRLAATQMGQIIAQKGMTLVYGGGNVGLMGIVADAALGAGGEVIGVIPEFLAQKELAHPGLTKLYTVESMHIRKAMMAEFSDAFIAMPGGFGTFEEFCEVLTWTQLGIHRKVHGLLNINGYYDALLKLFDDSVSAGFVKDFHRSLVVDSDDPQQLLNQLESFVLPLKSKWDK